MRRFAVRLAYCCVLSIIAAMTVGAQPQLAATATVLKPDSNEVFCAGVSGGTGVPVEVEHGWALQGDPQVFYGVAMTYRQYVDGNQIWSKSDFKTVWSGPL